MGILIFFKLQLMPPNEERLEHLCTQLQWRLTEFGECWYELGVSDNGLLTGIPRRTLSASMETLKRMCLRVRAQIVRFEKFSSPLGANKYVAEVHLRPQQRSHSEEGRTKRTEELRVAMVGQSGVGKSTLISVLAYGNLDNGRGDARLSLLRHRHEILTGRTSSVAVEPLLFISQEGREDELQPLRLDAMESADHLALSNQRLMLEAPKCVEFFDLPGQPRYHRSALSSLTSLAGPDLACLVISAVEEDLLGFQETAGLLTALSLPFIIVISKIDLNSEGWSRLAESLSCCGKPIFALSATTGQGVPELITYLSRHRKGGKCIEVAPRDASVFVIESVKQSDEVGLVAKGAMMQGRLDLMSSGSNAWRIGPMSRDGAFLPVSIVSIHRLRLPVHEIEAGLMAAVALSGPCQVTRGMLLVHSADTRRLTGKTTSHINWRGFMLITGSPQPEKEIQGILHCGCARVPVKARLGADDGGLMMDILEGGRVLVLAGMKMVLLTNSYIAAGLYTPSI